MCPLCVVFSAFRTASGRTGDPFAARTGDGGNDGARVKVDKRSSLGNIYQVKEVKLSAIYIYTFLFVIDLEQVVDLAALEVDAQAQ